MTECPCKGCKDRILACHTVCRAYKAWKKEKAAEMKTKIENNDLFRPLSPQAKKRWLLRLKRGRG